MRFEDAIVPATENPPPSIPERMSISGNPENFVSITMPGPAPAQNVVQPRRASHAGSAARTRFGMERFTRDWNETFARAIHLRTHWPANQRPKTNAVWR